MKSVAAAIDFGTSKIVTLLAESGGYNRFDIRGAGVVPYAGYRETGWNEQDKLAQAVRDSINAAELDSKSKIREVYVGVPCGFIRMARAEVSVPITASDGRVTEDDIDRVQDEAAERLRLQDIRMPVIHRSPAWFSVDNDKSRTMNPVGLKGSSLNSEISFILADPDFTRSVTSLLVDMGIGVLGFLSSSMGEGMLLLGYDERDKASALVDIGSLNTQICVFKGDAMIYNRVLETGSGYITSDLSMQLRIPMRTAEKIKREYVFIQDEFENDGNAPILFNDTTTGRSYKFPRDLVKNIIEYGAKDIVDGIRNSLEECRPLLSLKSTICVTGGMMHMKTCREFLTRELGRTIRVPKAKSSKLHTYEHASSLGLIDLIFDSIERQQEQEESLTGKLAGGFRGLWKKN